MNKNILSVAFTSLALVGFGQVALAHDEDEPTPPPIYRQPQYDPQSGDPRYADPRYADPRYTDARYADPRDDGRRQFSHGGSRLDYEVDHLNQMMAHVQGEMQRYGADGHIRGEYQHLRAEARQVSYQFRRGEQFYNRDRLRAEIAHMHGELHPIEQELHGPANAWFQWR